jgi:apolipoprotein N-acyltransferase
LLRVAALRLGWSVVVAAPVIWAGLELARGHLMTGFLMGTLAHTQYRCLPMIQISDLGGAYAVSFLLVMVAACVARMLPWDGCRRAIWPVLPLITVLLATWSYGNWRLGQNVRRPGPTVALIQGSVDTTMKTDRSQTYKIFDEYFGLSRAARTAEPKLDLIVWPETMFRFPWFTFSSDFRPPPGAVRTAEEVQQESRSTLQYAAQILQTPALLGIDTLHQTATREEHYNSALFIDSAGQPLGRYDKCHRVVFGEYVPLADMFPALYRLTPLPGGVEPGRGGASVKLGDFRYAPNICFETTVPHLIRAQLLELRARGEEPDVLVNLTNDGWFWGSTELDLHIACGVFRTIECRKPLVVAANTGFSASIDSDGRILAQGGRRKSEFLIARPELDDRGSWYLDHGDWPAGICLAGCCILGGVGLMDLRRRKA